MRDDTGYSVKFWQLGVKFPVWDFGHGLTWNFGSVWKADLTGTLTEIFLAL